MVSASTAPVASLRADSAITVCEIFGRTRMRANSGMRMTGSIGASTAPMRSPTVMGTSKTAEATTPQMTAVMITPGIARRLSPTATVDRTRAESCRPPWKRMNDTPSVRSTSAPTESSGTSIASVTEGPRSATAPSRSSM